MTPLPPSASRYTVSCPQCDRPMRRIPRTWIMRLFFWGSRHYACSACGARFLHHEGTLHPR